MKIVILTALVLAIEVGFVASVAMTPTPRSARPSGAEVVAGRNATELRTPAPASRG